MMINKSSIKIFLSCPAKFKQEVIDGKVHEQTEDEFQGKIVHKFIENFWKVVNIENGNLKYKLEDILPERELIEKYPKVKNSINNFIKFQEKRFNFLKLYKKENLFKPVLVEKTLVNEKLGIFGTPDYVDMNMDETYNVIDIKTNREFKFEEHLLDLIFYKYLLQNTTGIDPTFGIIYNPFVDNYKIIKLKESDIENLKNLIKLIKSCIKENNFPHWPGCNCEQT